QFTRPRNRTDMCDHFIAPNCSVLLADRKRVTGACGRQRFKTQMRQQTRRADIPRIGNDKRVIALMEGPKEGGFSCLSLNVISSRDLIVGHAKCERLRKSGGEMRPRDEDSRSPGMRCPFADWADPSGRPVNLTASSGGFAKPSPPATIGRRSAAAKCRRRD